MVPFENRRYLCKQIEIPYLLMISLSILLNKLPCSGQFNYLSDHILVKRAIDSMDDCFDFIEEPLYGFRVNVTQEIQCSELGAKYLVFFSSRSHKTREKLVLLSLYIF